MQPQVSMLLEALLQNDRADRSKYGWRSVTEIMQNSPHSHFYARSRDTWARWLNSLVPKGFVRKEWRDVNGIREAVYQITDVGCSYLAGDTERQPLAGLSSRALSIDQEQHEESEVSQ